MVVINKGEANDLFFTLKEKATLTTPYYLFVFTNDASAESKTFTATNISNYRDRYDRFTITESSTENLSSGVVELDAGFWSYSIYEQATSGNLDIANVTSKVEVGRVDVRGTETVKATNRNTRTYTVRNGG